jgi:hypothetical protein
MFAIFTHSATMFAVALLTLETDNSSRRTRRLDEQIVVHQFVRLIWILDNYVIEWLPSPVYEQINCPSKIVFTDGQVVEQIQTTCSSKILSDTFSHLMICPTKTIYSSKRLVRLLFIWYGIQMHLQEYNFFPKKRGKCSDVLHKLIAREQNLCTRVLNDLSIIFESLTRYICYLPAARSGWEKLCRRARDVFKTEGTVFLIRTDAAGK